MTDKQARAIRYIERTLGIKFDVQAESACGFIGRYLVKAQLRENLAELQRLENTHTRPPVWDLAGQRGPDPDRVDACGYAGQRYPGGTQDFAPDRLHARA